MTKNFEINSNLTGNQCKEPKTGAIWQNLGTMKTNLAIIFWTRCSLLMCFRSDSPEEVEPSQNPEVLSARDDRGRAGFGMYDHRESYRDW